METLQIIEVIKRLSLTENLDVIELIFKEIRKETAQKEQEEEKRKKAARLLLADYQTDAELTAFTDLAWFGKSGK
jgi:hypothetical protein